MKSVLSQTLFDYGDLTPADIKRCESAAEKITGKQRRIAADIVAIGQELIAVKHRLPHGVFGKWLEHHFGWSSSAAGRFMQAADVCGKFPNLGNLTIDQSALYLLSSNTCPDEVREELLEAAERGGRITHKQVKDAIAAVVVSDDEDVIEHDDDVDDDHEHTSDEWSVIDVIHELRAIAAKWRSRAMSPTELAELAEVFRDVANQIEGSSK